MAPGLHPVQRTGRRRRLLSEPGQDFRVEQVDLGHREVELQQLLPESRGDALHQGIPDHLLLPGKGCVRNFN